MLEKIRDGSQGLVAKVVLGAVMLSFIFAGVGSYLGKSSDSVAAKVDGTTIYVPELDKATENETNLFKEQYGDAIAKLQSNEVMRARALEKIISRILVGDVVSKLSLRISEEQVKNNVINDKSFQRDGKYDNEQYLAIINQLGYTPRTYKEYVQGNMARQQFLGAVFDSEFVLPSEVDFLLQIQTQNRVVNYKLINSNDFKENQTVTDSEVETFYKENLKDFAIPEKYSLNYVELSANELQKTKDITDAEIADFYDKNLDGYKEVEQRKAAHIFIDFAEDNAKAKLKADELYKQLQAGADFAELAKKDSTDTFSAKDGGELGWFKAGVMTADFDEVLFGLKKGEYSKVIETPTGWQIVKLIDIKPEVISPLADVKDSIVEQLASQKAISAFYDLQSKLSEISYNSDDLKSSAELLGVKIKTTPLFSLDSPVAPFDTPSILDELKELDSHNSSVLSLGKNHLLVYRVNEQKEETNASLDSVKDKIIEQLKTQKAMDLAKNEADKAVASLNKGDKYDLPNSKTVDRADQELDRALLLGIFSLASPSADKPTYSVIPMSTGYAVVALTKIESAPKIEEGLKKSLEDRIESQNINAGYVSFIEDLKEKGSVQYINVSLDGKK